MRWNHYVRGNKARVIDRSPRRGRYSAQREIAGIGGDRHGLRGITNVAGTLSWNKKSPARQKFDDKSASPGGRWRNGPFTRDGHRGTETDHALDTGALQAKSLKRGVVRLRLGEAKGPFGRRSSGEGWSRRDRKVARESSSASIRQIAANNSSCERDKPVMARLGNQTRPVDQ